MSPLLPDDILRTQLPAPALKTHYESVALNVARVVWRYKGLIALLLAAALAAAFAAIVLLDKQYTADALIHVDVGRRDQGLASERTASNLTLDAAAVVESEARIIRSRAIARRVVSRLGLVEHPAFAPAEPSGPGLISWVLGIAAWADTAIAEGRVPAIDTIRPAETADAVPMTELVVLDLLKNLSVQNDSRSYLISVAYTSGDPELSAAIANSFADEYMQSRIEANLAAAGGLSEWLAAQMRDARASLRGTEQAIQALREQTGIIIETGPEGASVLQQQLRDVTAQLSAASVTRLAEEGRLRRAQALVQGGKLPPAADLASSPIIQRLLEGEATARRELANLSSRYGEKHPDVARARSGLEEIQARLSAEIGRVLAGMEAHVIAAREAERALEVRLADLQRARIDAKRGETQLRDLQSTADAIRDRLKALTASYEQALAVKELKPLNAQLVVRAEAVPLPSGPNQRLILGLALLGALVVGVVMAVLLDRRDAGFRTATEVRGATDSWCVGMVPELPAASLARLDTVAGPSDQSLTVFCESVRAIGAAVSLTGPTAGKVVLITSSVPGEGKSVIASALAGSLVATGARVLLIDGAPKRRSRGAAQASAILESVLSDDDAGCGFFDSRADERLSVLHRASGLRDGQKVFTGGAFETMLNEARTRYDVILVEGPPVMLLADSFVLGRYADTVLHVAKWHGTRRKTVTAALRRLKDMSVRVTGVVLSRVDMKRHRKYAFFDEVYFYRRYRKFYEASYQ